jgi:hypothetical protein
MGASSVAVQCSQCASKRSARAFTETSDLGQPRHQRAQKAPSHDDEADKLNVDLHKLHDDRLPELLLDRKLDATATISGSVITQNRKQTPPPEIQMTRDLFKRKAITSV